MIMRIIFAIFISVIFIISNSFIASADSAKADTQAPAGAQTSAKEKGSKDEEVEGTVITSVSAKQITGQVSGISKDYIGVLYQGENNTEYEMGIFIEGAPELERVDSLSQIQAGDTVTVKYNEVNEEDKETGKSARHVVKKISLLKKAPPPPPETNTMISVEDKE